MSRPLADYGPSEHPETGTLAAIAERIWKEQDKLQADDPEETRISTLRRLIGFGERYGSNNLEMP